MAAAVQLATGVWSASGTWVAGVIPGIGDTATTAATHVLTNDVNTTVGVSPDGTTLSWAIDIVPTSRLVNNAGVTLRVRGPLRVQNTASQTTHLDAIENSGTIMMDATAAAAPTTSTYRIEMGQNLWCYRRYKSSGGRLTSDITGGAAKGYFTSANGVCMDLSNGAIIDEIGDATRRAFAPPYQSSANSRFVLTDALLRNTGGVVGTSSIGASVVFQLTRVTMIGTTHTQSFKVQGGTSSHVIDDCSFDKQCEFNSCAFSVRGGTTFHAGLLITGSRLSQYDDCLTFLPSASAAPGYAAAPNREYRIIVRSASNAKAFMVGNYGSQVDSNDMIIEPLGATGSDGEFWAGQSGTPAGTSTATRPIFMPHHDGTSMRSLEVLTDATDVRVIEHGTVAAYLHSIGFGHAGHTTANNGVERARVINTLFCNFSGSTNTSKIGIITNAVTGSYTGANADYNARANVAGAAAMIAGSQGNGYDVAPSSGTPGVHDVTTGDPLFIGATGGGLARLWTWGRDVLGLTGTTAQIEDAALLAIQVRHLAPSTYGYGGGGATGWVSSGATVTALHTWVVARWKVQNPALQADSLGGWIGAAGGELPPASDPRVFRATIDVRPMYKATLEVRPALKATVEARPRYRATIVTRTGEPQ